MKELFKKKGNSSAKVVKPTPTAKKPLFSKKNTESSKESAPKKPLLGKKTVKIKPIKASNTAKTSALDTKKIIAILIVLLVLILGALAARMFVFNTESIDTVYTPATEEEVQETSIDSSLITADESATTQEQDSSTDTVSSSEPLDSSAAAPITPTEQEQPSQPQELQEIQPLTLEDFKQEAAIRVYRERETAASTQGR